MNTQAIVNELQLNPSMNIRQLVESVITNEQYKDLKAKEIVEIVLTLKPDASTTEKCVAWYRNNLKKDKNGSNAKLKAKIAFKQSLVELDKKAKQDLLLKLVEDNLDTILDKIDLSAYMS